MINIDLFIENDRALWIYFIITLALIIIPIIILLARDNLTKLLSMSAFSSLICVFYLMLDSLDVALTESSIGACLTTVITAIFLTKIKEEPNYKKTITSLIVPIMAIFGVIAFVASLDELLPELGNGLSPANLGVSKYYIENTEKQIGIKSIVAAILGSYRGFDTLGETLVVLSAGASVMLILGIRNEKKH